MATVPITWTSIGPISNDSSLLAPDLMLSRLCFFVDLTPSEPSPIQSSPRIWLSLPTSPAFCAFDQSRSSCLRASTVPEATWLFACPYAGLWRGARSLDAGLREDVARKATEIQRQANNIKTLSQSPK